MVSSWFGGNDGGRSSSSSASVQDLVLKHMCPKASHYDRGRSRLEQQSRFSQLMLEHGELELQDWAVVAYSTPCKQTDVSERSSPRKSDKIQWAQAPTSTRISNSSNGGGGGGSHSPSRRKKAGVSNLVGSGAPTKAAAAMDKDAYPSVHMNKLEGRLHLCSRSLVFEPTESSRGIVRCPFSRMDEAPREYPGDPGFMSMCIEFLSSRHLVIKANNVIGPYQAVSVLTQFRFTFLHSSPTAFCELALKLYLAATQHKKGMSSHAASAELDNLLQPMLERPFNVDNLVDVREQILTSNVRCSIQSPLQSMKGVLALTVDRIYFQPASGVLSATDARPMKWLQRDVAATARRYNGLRDSALEIYWKDETSTLFAFDRRHDREQVMRFLQNVVPCFTDREFVVQVFQAWQDGKLSNYDYLLALNVAAGRSFHDLSRYPVFPWVVADYESSKLDLSAPSTYRDLTKPIGAINEKRLEYFRNRMLGMAEMDESPFLYGTHYSAPGYVLYYLVRMMPEHQLCLQNGKWDAADRLFHSVSHCYNCVLTNHADVKELIPEFYNPGNFDFLINARGLQLGATQNGERVDDVALPPWARSARDFVRKNRKALESDHCTSLLPRWIDLIFGCKSRGEPAKEASNLFHQMAYLGPNDLADMQTPEERIQAELQATEFGIVPDMLFQAAHPSRQDKGCGDGFISPDIGRASSKDEGGNAREAWELLDPPPSIHDGDRLLPGHENPAMDVVADAADDPKNTSIPPELRPEEPGDVWVDEVQQTPPLSDNGANLPLRGTGERTRGGNAFQSSEEPLPSTQAPQPPPPEPSPMIPMSDSTALVEWDMNVIERKRIHGDTVSGCVLLLNQGETKRSLLATTSLDGALMVHTLDLSSGEDRDLRGFSSTLTRFSYSTILSRGNVMQSAASKLIEYRSHSSRDPLASLVLANDGSGGSVAFAGGHDDVVLAYGINSSCAVASVYSHRDAVTGLDLITRTPFDGDSTLWVPKTTHIMVSGSWDATVKVWSVTISNGESVSVSREPLAELFDADASIVCVSAKSIPTGGIVICAGCADGGFTAWNVHNDGVQVVIHHERARRGSGPCSVVQWVSEAGRIHLFAAFSTGKVVSYTLVDGSLQRQSAVAVGVAVSSMVYSRGALLLGCADGSLRLIPVRDGAKIESKPTMWTAVNNKSSPGISSISVTYMQGSKQQGNRSPKCICCTGAEDGSVALFELKKV